MIEELRNPAETELVEEIAVRYLGSLGADLAEQRLEYELAGSEENRSYTLKDAAVDALHDRGEAYDLRKLNEVAAGAVPIVRKIIDDIRANREAA